MQILIASESFYPAVSGVSVTAERLAAQMAARGHQVFVAAPSRNRSYLRENRRGYTIYRIPSWPNPFRKGFRFTIFPYRHMRKIMAEVKPDIVHIHDPAMLCSSAARLARYAHIPVVATNHFTYEYLLTYLPWLKPLHLLIQTYLAHDLATFYDRCSVLTVPTRTTRDYLRTEHKLKVPIEIISNGVDITRFSLYYKPTELLSRYSLQVDLPIITYVGRMDAEKNLPTLLHALAQVAKTSEIQAVFVGSGNLLPQLQELAEELGLAAHIVWINRLDNRSSLLNQLYHLTRIFCIPSPVETESMVTMEALASGLPVVAANSGALPELVKDGDNGFLVPSKNIQKWSQAITTLLEDDELCQRMARRSIETIAQRDLSHTVDAFENLYKRLLIESTFSAHPDLRLPQVAD